MGSIPAENELLCETCGYDIGGIPPEGKCPECGREVRESRPERRVGSPWQVRRSIRSWAVTNISMLRRPGIVFDRMRMDHRDYLSLLGVNLVIAGALLALPWVGTLIGDPARNARTASRAAQVLLPARSALIGTAAIAMILFLLTFIEAAGIRLFGRRRGWRITGAIAWQICAHASVGWILAAVLTLLSLVIWLNVTYFGLSGWIERAGGTGSYLTASIPLAGFFAGMLVFEVLVYLGMRRCRFANAPRP